MVDILDRLEKEKRRELARKQKAEQAAVQERQAAAKRRKLEGALAMRQAVLMGEAVRDATLSPDERKALGAVLARHPDKAKDWDKVLAAWVVAPAVRSCPFAGHG